MGDAGVPMGVPGASACSSCAIDRELNSIGIALAKPGFDSEAGSSRLRTLPFANGPKRAIGHVLGAERYPQTLVVPEVRPQQNDVRDAFDGEGGELVGEDGSKSPAMFPLVRSEAARHRGNLAEVCSVGVRSRPCEGEVPSVMITMCVSQFSFRRHRGTVAEENRVEAAAARTAEI